MFYLMFIACFPYSFASSKMQRQISLFTMEKIFDTSVANL